MRINTFILLMIYNNINKFHTVYYGPVSCNSIPSSIRGSKSMAIFFKRLRYELIFMNDLNKFSLLNIY